MLDTQTEREYKRLRKLGWLASYAIAHARTKAEWRALAGVEVYDGDPFNESKAAAVRIRIVADDQPETVLDFDCQDEPHKRIIMARKGYETIDSYQCDWDKGEPCKAHKTEIDRLNRDGAFGIVGEYRTLNGQWEHASSVWGFIGDDWRDYADADVMHETMTAYHHFIGC